jgi:hypothetical protein
VAAIEEQVDATYPGRIIELEKQLDEQKHVEDDLRGHTEELSNTLIKEEKLEANLHGLIKELEEKFDERDADKEKWETTLCGKIKHLNNKVREEYSAGVSVALKLYCKIRELCEDLAISEQEKDALHDVIDKRGKLLKESATKQQESARHHKGIASCLRYINRATCFERY